VIVDLVGKRNRVRSVPLPSWAKAAIDAWSEAARISEGRVFRRLLKGGRVNGASMTPQVIYDVVRHYAEECGFVLAAHDLPRTFAKLAHKGKGGIDQTQLSLWAMHQSRPQKGISVWSRIYTTRLVTTWY